jgi:hypothetical protein
MWLAFLIQYSSVQTRYPTYVGDVAEVCLQLCEQRIKQVYFLNFSLIKSIFSFF